MPWILSRKHLRIPEADRRELEAMERESEAQKVEARSLLADARVIAQKCRESRERNHYRLVLDEILKGAK